MALENCLKQTYSCNGVVWGKTDGYISIWCSMLPQGMLWFPSNTMLPGVLAQIHFFVNITQIRDIQL